MITRRMLLAITLLLLSTPATPTAPASAASSGTPCTFEYDAVISPGLSSSPSSGTIKTNGETGTITCNGPVNGKQPTGPGTFGVGARYGTKGGATCQSGGDVDGVLSLPSRPRAGPST